MVCGADRVPDGRVLYDAVLGDRVMLQRGAHRVIFYARLIHKRPQAYWLVDVVTGECRHSVVVQWPTC